MTERLNNTEISQRIIDANSDLQRYLNLAPSLRPNPVHPTTAKEYPQRPISTTPFLRPKLKP